MKNTGFTFIEVIIASTIFLFIVGGIYAMMNSGKNLYDSDSVFLDLQSEARRVMDTITAELRQSSFDNVTLTESGRHIEFEVPLNISVSPVSYSGPIAYYMDAEGAVIREYPAGTENVLSVNGGALNFYCCDAGGCSADCGDANSVLVVLSLAKDYKERPLYFNVTEKVVTRNDF